MLRFTEDELRNMSSLDYVKALNAELRAQARLPPSSEDTFMILPTEDANFHKEFASAYEYLRSMRISEISDAFKEMHGFRPRGIYNFDAMSLEELDAVVDQIFDAMTHEELDAVVDQIFDGYDDDADDVPVLPEAAPLTHNPFSILAGKF